ncbi:hypothetical protein [Streptomyces sp. NPDC001508]|uniref:hypothetical protein n=1 Tax=Streptomyces sp. NPDC001508 TaxID=3154656 RepID=UPI00332662FF
MALAEYMAEEFAILFESVLNGWLRQLLEHTVGRMQVPELETVLRVPGKHVWESFHAVGRKLHAEAVTAVAEGDVAQAGAALDRTRLMFKTINDETVRFIQDLLTALDEREGEHTPIEAMRGAYETIWRDRYRSWNDLTPEEKLQLSCEGMRTHFGGPLRDGAFEVFDDGDRYRMQFAVCGTGGMLRYGDPETDGRPWPTTGVNRTPQPWSWGKVGVPWYCTHCSLFLEHWPAEDYGHPLRPLLYDDDEDSPLSTSWFIYKQPGFARPEDLVRIGRGDTEREDER